jgi:hypothetical protein
MKPTRLPDYSAPQLTFGSTIMIAKPSKITGRPADGGYGIARGAANFLCFAAAPTFAIMALHTGILGRGTADMFCSTEHGASVLTGTVPMYIAMSTLHLAPWLRLVSR